MPPRGSQPNTFPSLSPQTSLNKLLETLGKAEPFFIRCIRSNAEKVRGPPHLQGGESQAQVWRLAGSVTVCLGVGECWESGGLVRRVSTWRKQVSTQVPKTGGSWFCYQPGFLASLDMYFKSVL